MLPNTPNVTRTVLAAGAAAGRTDNVGPFI